MRGGIKMKRLIAALSVFMCFNPLHADNFGPDDKILYFSSDVLINVIKNTFDEKLQLAVARKYVDLMDENGNVSISDLVSICDTGKLDNIQCRGFIQSLIDTTDGSLKTFYWADYVGKGNITGLKVITGDGYSGQSKYIGPGGWYVQFDWTHDNFHSHDKAFKLAYPGSNAIIGTSACTNEPGTPYIADNTKNFASNEQTGEHCWCKMIGPEETHWIYLENVEENNRKYGINTTEKTGCARKCASDCLYEIRGQRIYKDVKPNGSPWSKGEDWVFYHLDMQKAMFTAIKLNKSIANVGEDGNTIEKDLNKEFKPCEFDWGKITEKDLYGEGYRVAAEQHSVSLRNRPKDYGGFIRYRAYTPYKCIIGVSYDEQRKGYYDYGAECGSKVLNIKDEFILHYIFMDRENFQCKYPDVKYLRGTAACTNDYGGTLGNTTNKQYTPLENSGPFCWCQIVSPEKSKWVYADQTYDDVKIQSMRKEFRTKPFGCMDICMSYCIDIYSQGFELKMIQTIK